MREHELAVRLTLCGPILSRATTAGAVGVDAPVARSVAKQPVLAGSLVKGKLREAWDELVEAWPSVPPDSDDLLGKQGDASAPWGRLHFGDLEAAGGGDELRHRIRLDGFTGSVEHGALQTVESPFAPGQQVEYAGSVHFVPRTETEAEQIRSQVEVGLRWVASFGALRTAGFGRLLAAEVGLQPVDAPEPAASVTGREEVGGGVTVSLRFDRPLCVSDPQSISNLVVSREVLPGGTLKGALAATWRESLGLPAVGGIGAGMDPARPDLCAHFSRLRVTHAFPTLEAHLRPVVPPLSLVKVKEGDVDKLYDVALLPEAGLVAGEVPSFAIDWKTDDDVRRELGWPELDRELRVRTAIDRFRRRAADEQLFAYEMVVAPEEVVWQAAFSVGDVEPEVKSRLREQLLSLLRTGLRGVGKTKARAEIEVLAAAPPPEPSAADRIGRDDAPGLWVLSLQTPALLCDPAELDETSGRRELAEAYGCVWRQISEESLRLVRYFARQSLAGGEYLHRRFGIGDPYDPFLLTDEGSVFVLETCGDPATAERIVRGWMRDGLPLPAWARKRFAVGEEGQLWRSCPFVPENGYGEVRVNLPLHWERKPPEGQEVATDG